MGSSEYQSALYDLSMYFPPIMFAVAAFFGFRFTWSKALAMSVLTCMALTQIATVTALPCCTQEQWALVMSRPLDVYLEMILAYSIGYFAISYLATAVGFLAGMFLRRVRRNPEAAIMKEG